MSQREREREEREERELHSASLKASSLEWRPVPLFINGHLWSERPAHPQSSTAAAKMRSITVGGEHAWPDAG